MPRLSSLGTRPLVISSWIVWLACCAEAQTPPTINLSCDRVVYFQYEPVVCNAHIINNHHEPVEVSIDPETIDKRTGPATWEDVNVVRPYRRDPGPPPVFVIEPRGQMDRQFSVVPYNVIGHPGTYRATVVFAYWDGGAGTETRRSAIFKIQAHRGNAAISASGQEAFLLDEVDVGFPYRASRLTKDRLEWLAETASNASLTRPLRNYLMLLLAQDALNGHDYNLAASWVSRALPSGYTGRAGGVGAYLQYLGLWARWGLATTKTACAAVSTSFAELLQVYPGLSSVPWVSDLGPYYSRGLPN